MLIVKMMTWSCRWIMKNITAHSIKRVNKNSSCESNQYQLANYGNCLKLSIVFHGVAVLNEKIVEANKGNWLWNNRNIGHNPCDGYHKRPELAHYLWLVQKDSARNQKLNEIMDIVNNAAAIQSNKSWRNDVWKKLRDTNPIEQ